MKAIKIICHPAVLIFSFCFIIISGESFGGFYLLYLLMALPHAGLHALLAVIGIILLSYSNFKYQRQFKYLLEPIINITGTLCLVASIIYFFYRDISHYNYQTFTLVIPVMTLVVFGALVCTFVVSNLIRMKYGRVTI